MAKDFKDSKRKGGGGGGIPGPVWMLGGFALGVAVTVIYRVGTPQVVEQRLASAPAPASTAPAPSAPTKFDFYGMLENFEVVVPGQIKQPPKPATDGAPAAAAVYELQVGAFRTEAEADRMRAQLALIGVEARIQKNVVDDKETWFRVRVGPLKGEAELTRARDRLTENHIKFMTLRGSA
jgi:cell division protein FtsN